MRLPALLAAAALSLAAASPAIAATTTVSAATPLEQLLIDVSAARTTSTNALEKAGGNEDAVRRALTDWREALIDASDELSALRADAEKTHVELPKSQVKAFDAAEEKIRSERADLRALRAELLPEDPTVVLPAPVRLLGGLVDTVAADAVERSDEPDKRIVYGIPGSDVELNLEEPAGEPKPAAPKPAAPKPAAPNAAVVTPAAPKPAAPTQRFSHRADRLAESETSTSTTTEGETTTTPSVTATTTAETTTPTAETTTSSTAPTSIMRNRTTSAQADTTTSSSSTTRSSTTQPTTTENDDDEREDDLAETGTPMRGLILLGVLTMLAGLAMVRRPA